MSKNLQTHIKYKYDSETNWNSAGWTSRVGEIYVYAPDSDHTETRLKIGDGIHTVIELPWAYIGDYTPPLVPVAAVPSQSGTLTYNGGSQSPSWSNYNSGQLTLSGTTAGTNAGSYTATFTPASGYCWPDGTTTAKNVVWSIAKATPTLSLNKSSVALSSSTTSATVTITTNSTGSLTVSSNNSTYISASINSKTITVRSVNYTSGTATITVSLAATTNYNARSTSFSVTATFSTVSNVLNNNSWETISKVAKEGNADQYWNVGDTKQVSINHTLYVDGNEELIQNTYNVFIVGFDRVFGGQIDFQCFKTTNGTPICLIDRKYNMSSYADSSMDNGFALTYSDEMMVGDDYTYNTEGSGYSEYLIARSLDYSAISNLRPKLIDAFPSDLRNVMVSIYGHTYFTHYKSIEKSEGGTWVNEGGTTHLEPDMSEYKLILPSVGDILIDPTFYDELFYESYADATALIDNTLTTSGVDYPYPYYANGNSYIKYSHKSNSTAVSYWLRDGYEYGEANAYLGVSVRARMGFFMSSYGDVTATSCERSLGVCPIFRVGNAY